MSFTFQRRLFVDGSALKPATRSGWEAAILYQLHHLTRSNTGLCILHQLHLSVNNVWIAPYLSAAQNSDATPTDWARATYPAHPIRYGDGAKAVPPQMSTGLGSDVVVHFTPWRFPSGDTRSALLIHELTHATEQAAGHLFCNPLGYYYDTVAEFDAILVENIYRSEMGLPLARDHRLPRLVLNTETMVPTPAFIRLLRSFRDRMPGLAQHLGDVKAAYNPLRKGAGGYVGVQGDVPGDLRYS